MKRIAILGAGESGVGAAILAQKEGWEVWVSDFGKVKERYRNEMEEHRIPYEEEGHDQERILKSELVVKSPGIPEKAPMVQEIRKAGIELVSEIEFASRYTDATLVAITGSNGKTTTAMLTHHLLKKGGFDVGLAGNIGDSFARQVAQKNHPVYVLEVSSFQLDDISTFRPHIAILTNITADHLDRYEYDLRKYAHAKFRITENQQAEDHFIYCLDDPKTQELLPEYDIKANTYGFSFEQKKESVAWVENDAIHIEMNLDNTAFTIESMTLQGRHNLYNTMAAAVVGRIQGMRKSTIRESFSDFRNVEHRLERISMVRGVEFVNDSKATNVNSTWYALESITKPIIWIAGGVDKGNDYSILEPLVSKKVKAIVAIGEDVLKIHHAFSRKVDLIVNTQSMEEAVKMGYHLADSGDCVLLSPACASFDLFENYEDRGRQFKHFVKQL